MSKTQNKIEYVFKDKEHKDGLRACYFIEHPNKKRVTDKELNEWCVKIAIELYKKENEQ
jgi:hypothetical protein